MASRKTILCEPCRASKNNTNAEVWCNNCNEGFCLNCLSLHQQYEASRDHKTIDADIYIKSSAFVNSIKTECDIHDKKFELYCPSHLKPCCEECMSTEHYKCTGIKALSSVVEETRKAQSVKAIEKDVNTILLLVEEIIENRKEAIQKIDDQRENVKSSVAKIRQQLNQHLDTLEEKMINDINSTCKTETSRLSGILSEFETKRRKLIEMQHNLQRLQKHASDLHSFLGTHQMEILIHQNREWINNLDKDDRMKEVGIKIKINEELERNVFGIESFGKVSVEKTPTAVTINQKANRQAQFWSKQTNLNNIHLELQMKADIPSGYGRYITDIVSLTNGDILLVDNEDGELLLFHSNGNFNKSLSSAEDPSHVTQIADDTIAVSYPDETSIKIISVSNDKVIKTIELDKKGYALSYRDGSLAVGMEDEEVRFIDLDGNVMKSIKVQTTPDGLIYLLNTKERLVYSNSDAKSVHCVDTSGNPMWKYQLQNDTFENPQGICEDNYGNFFVAGYTSNNIIAISKDGQNSKELLSEDVVSIPKAVGFNKRNSTLSTCDCTGKYLAIFKVLYK